MKKTSKFLLIAVLLTAFFTSCEEDLIKPSADFSYAPTEITAWDVVSFTNATVDGDTYSWDFGDGNTSTDENPTHTYIAAGTYIVTLTATNTDGDNVATQTLTVIAPANTVTIDGTELPVDADMFWYQSSMGGDPYLRLIYSVAGQDNPDLLKLYPNKGLEDLPNTYIFNNADSPAGTYDAGYTANYAGMAYDWTAIGKTGSGNLVITELATGLYKCEAEIVLSVGTYDYITGEFTETEAKNLSLDYIGAITPL